MPGYRLLIFILIIGLDACNSPEDRISNAQKRLLEVLHHREYFEIRAEGQVLKLPLPPDEQQAEANRQTLSQIESELQAMNNEKLDAGFKQKREELLRLLQSLRATNALAGFDPLACVITDTLSEVVDKQENALFQALTKQLAAYYAMVEARWQPCPRARAREAAERSVPALELLSRLDAPQEARMAVKDFIGLCNSAMLQ